MLEARGGTEGSEGSEGSAAWSSVGEEAQRPGAVARARRENGARGERLAAPGERLHVALGDERAPALPAGAPAEDRRAVAGAELERVRLVDVEVQLGGVAGA